MFLNDEDEEYHKTLSKFERMLKTNKVIFFDSEEFEDIVLHYLDSGRLLLAKKALKLALEQHPKSTGLKLIQVEIYITENKLEAAEKLVNELLEFEPQNDEIYIQKSNIYSKQGDHKQAIELLKIALEHTEDIADLYNLIGMEYLFMDELELAKTNFIKCLEQDLDDQSALYNIVYCYEFLEQFDEAIVFLQQYVNNRPYAEIAWHQIGRLHYILKNYSNAAQAFEFATYIDELFVGAYVELAKTYEKLKEYELAIENYQQALNLEDATSYALLRMGKCYNKLKNNKLAIEYYYKAIHEDPLLDKGWLAVTNFYLKEKNFTKALKYINEALQIDNKNAKYWKKYATINRKLNNWDGAVFGYRMAVENGDTRLDTWLFWIDILIFSTQYKMAVDTLLSACEYYPDNDEIEYRLASMHFILNKTIRAKFHLVNALKLNFNNHLIIAHLSTDVWNMDIVQKTIEKYNIV